MSRNLKAVHDFVQVGPFTEGQVRWWIFQAQQNGLEEAGAIVRIQRRVYVDCDRFDDWISRQNPPKAKSTAAQAA